MTLTRIPEEQTIRRPTIPFYWHSRDLSIDALTGQLGVFSRDALSAVLEGWNGTDLPPYPPGHPAWGAVTAQDIMRTAFVLGEDDLHHWPVLFPWATGSLYVAFVDLVGGNPSADLTIAALGKIAVPAGQPRVSIRRLSSNGRYQAIYEESGGTETATLDLGADSASAEGDLVELLVTWDAAGAVRVRQAIDGVEAASVTGTADATLPDDETPWGGTAGSSILTLGSALDESEPVELAGYLYAKVGPLWTSLAAGRSGGFS